MLPDTLGLSFTLPAAAEPDGAAAEPEGDAEPDVDAEPAADAELDADAEPAADADSDGDAMVFDGVETDADALAAPPAPELDAAELAGAVDAPPLPLAQAANIMLSTVSSTVPRHHELRLGAFIAISFFCMNLASEEKAL